MFTESTQKNFVMAVAYRLKKLSMGTMSLMIFAKGLNESFSFKDDRIETIKSPSGGNRTGRAVNSHENSFCRNFITGRAEMQGGFTILTKEQILDACSMRLDGYTLQEIADKYGVTRQYIATLVPRNAKTNTICTFPLIKNWMAQNGYNGKKIAEFCGVTPNAVYAWLKGSNSITKANIDKILQLTGMTYEEAFREENPCDKL